MQKLKLYRRSRMVLILSLITQVSFGQIFQLQADFGDICKLNETNGVSMADYDRDGDMDVFIVTIHQFETDNGQTMSRLLRNDGVDGFVDVTEESKLSGSKYKLRNGWMGDRMAASWGDYNNDGFADLFLTNNGLDELWQNLGNGQFRDVTKRANVGGCSDCYSSNGLWWDYDIDGDLDLYVSDWLRINRLHRNNGDGTFTDVSEVSGLNDTSKTWTSVPIDVNNDHYPDLYVVNDFGANRFFINNQDGTFTEATAEYGLENEGDGMGVDIGDFNNDGHFDIYVTNIFRHVPNALFVGSANGTFTEKAAELQVENTEWGWGARFFDADHDMDEDLYVVNGMSLSAGRGNKNVFFLNEGGIFRNLSEELQLDNAIEARGLEVLDYDLDGDLDMLVANRGAPASFYKNMLQETTSELANWVQLQLEGTISNFDALGAIVKINCGGDEFIRLHTGANLFGQSIQPVHFGLSQHERIDEIEITWPNGVKEYFANIEANQILKLIEGTGSNQSSLTTSSANILMEAMDVYPNPFLDQLNIDLGNTEMKPQSVMLLDVLGRVVYHQDFRKDGSSNKLLQLNNLNLEPGLYLYEIKGVERKYTGKILRQN